MLCPFSAGTEWRGRKSSYSKVTQSIPELAAKNESSKRRGRPFGIGSTEADVIEQFDRAYDRIIRKAYRENPVQANPSGRRGWPKRGKILSVIDRLRDYKDSVCLVYEEPRCSMTTTKQNAIFA